MRVQIRKVKRRLPKKSASDKGKEEESGVENLEKLFKKVSLNNVSLEERRREANKPLYLVRYE